VVAATPRLVLRQLLEMRVHQEMPARMVWAVEVVALPLIKVAQVPQMVEQAVQVL
jgi:hypothetical protein